MLSVSDITYSIIIPPPPHQVSPTRKGRVSGDKLLGVRDARELISRPRAASPPTITDYIRNLEQQIRNSEKGARMLVAEARNAKRDLDKYLEDSELKELTDRREERRRREPCTRKREENVEDRSRERRKPRERSREQKKPHESSRRPHQSREARSRKSDSSERTGGEDPASWKIIHPSEVDVSRKQFSARFMKLFDLFLNSLLSMQS